MQGGVEVGYGSSGVLCVTVGCCGLGVQGHDGRLVEGQIGKRGASWSKGAIALSQDTGRLLDPVILLMTPPRPDPFGCSGWERGLAFSPTPSVSSVSAAERHRPSTSCRVCPISHLCISVVPPPYTPNCTTISINPSTHTHPSHSHPYSSPRPSLCFTLDARQRLDSRNSRSTASSCAFTRPAFWDHLLSFTIACLSLSSLAHPLENTISGLTQEYTKYSAPRSLRQRDSAHARTYPVGPTSQHLSNQPKARAK